MTRKIYLYEQALLKMLELTKNYKFVENGGFIFGRMNPQWIRIYDVSDAGPKAVRSKYSVIFDNDHLLDYSQQREEEDYFFLGTWHSHPPGYSIYPSIIDKNTMVDLSRNHELRYFPIFCITKYENELFYFNFYELNKDNDIVKRDCILMGS